MAVNKEDRDRIFNYVCSQIEIGRSVTDILTDKGMPSREAFYEWMRADKTKVDNYAKSLEIRADYYFDEMVKIAYNTEEGETIKDGPNGVEITKADMLGHRRLKVDTLKWVLSRMNPKKYGDKTDITTNGNELNAPKTIMTDAQLLELKQSIEATK